MSNLPKSFELYGLFLYFVDKSHFVVLTVDSQQRYLCYYPDIKKYPLQSNDVIYAPCEIQRAQTTIKDITSSLKLLQFPLMLISNKEEAIKSLLIKACKTSRLADAAYEELFQTEHGEIIRNLTERADKWYRSQWKLDCLSKKVSKSILREWYYNRIIRQFELYGLTRKDVNIYLKYAHVNSLDLLSKCRKAPYSIFNISLSKAKELTVINGNIPTDIDIRLGKLIRSLYAALFESPARMSLELKVIKDLSIDQRLKLQNDYPISITDRLELSYIHHVRTDLLFRLQTANDKGKTIMTNIDPPSELAPSQALAYKAALSNHLTLITGNAGTGKTTLIKQLLASLVNKSVIVTSFMGKAVEVLRKLIDVDIESKSLIVATMHRLVVNFTSLNADYLFVDEVSTITMELLHKVLCLFEKPPQIILVGDPNQLPPIGWGSLLELLGVSSAPSRFETVKNLNHVKLTDEFRLSDHLLANSRLWLKEERLIEGPGVYFFHGRGYAEVEEIMQMILEENKWTDFMVISILNAHVNEVNIKAQLLHSTMLKSGNSSTNQSVNTEPTEILDSLGRKWYLGDKIMFRKNFESFGLFNGMEGEITKIDPIEKSIEVTFGAMEIEFENTTIMSEGTTQTLKIEVKHPIENDVDLLDERALHEKEDKDLELDTGMIQLSYGITIHKSQGSQWKYVILYLPYKRWPERFKDQFRELVYTAITRASKGLFIVGNVPTK